jgi:hypothetical protein
MEFQPLIRRTLTLKFHARIVGRRRAEVKKSEVSRKKTLPHKNTDTRAAPRAERVDCSAKSLAEI